MMRPEKIDKKEFILDVAEKLFSEIGYDAASTRTIAAKAGINMAMLSYYFGSKDGLYKAVLERRSGEVSQTESTLNEDAGSFDNLYRWIDDYIDAVLSNIDFQRMIHRELTLQQRSDMTDFISENLLRTVNELRAILKEGMQNQTFREVDIELTIATIIGTEYYIVNSSQIASKILNKDLQNRQIMNEEIKPRLKKHLNDLLNAHLKRPDLEG